MTENSEFESVESRLERLLGLKEAKENEIKIPPATNPVDVTVDELNEFHKDFFTGIVAKAEKLNEKDPSFQLRFGTDPTWNIKTRNDMVQLSYRDAGKNRKAVFEYYTSDSIQTVSEYYSTKQEEYKFVKTAGKLAFCIVGTTITFDIDALSDRIFNFFLDRLQASI